MKCWFKWLYHLCCSWFRLSVEHLFNISRGSCEDFELWTIQDGGTLGHLFHKSIQENKPIFNELVIFVSSHFLWRDWGYVATWPICNYCISDCEKVIIPSWSFKWPIRVLSSYCVSCMTPFCWIRDTKPGYVLCEDCWGAWIRRLRNINLLFSHFVTFLTWSVLRNWLRSWGCMLRNRLSMTCSLRDRNRNWDRCWNWMYFLRLWSRRLCWRIKA